VSRSEPPAVDRPDAGPQSRRIFVARRYLAGRTITLARVQDIVRLLHDLEPAVVENFERHLTVAKEWMPHEYVPWSLGRDYADLGGTEWDPEQSRLSPVARTALEVNLLTEDNLPSYHREIERAFGRDRAWGAWVHRWTAEEARHAYCIRDYLLVTRGVDPVELERARMNVMETGYDAKEKPVLNVLAYVSFQELATRISHRNTGRYAADPICEKLLTRVSTDENLHMIFYRNLVTAALKVAPGPTIRAIADEVMDFEMPGAVIPGFTRKAAQIAQAGIYDLRIHHDDIVQPLLRNWAVFDIEGLDAEGEKAREELAEFVTGLSAQATRFEEQRERTRARIAARQA
jgi:acyl-[acyl-carrier-protein] desaturase